MAKGVNTAKNRIKMQRREVLSYAQEVAAYKLSEVTGFTPKYLKNWQIHLGAVTNYLGNLVGGKGFQKTRKAPNY